MGTGSTLKRKLSYFLLVVVGIAVVGWLLATPLHANNLSIQWTNILVGIIFGVSLMLKLNAKTSTKHFNAMLQMLSTFFIKMMGIILLIVIIYFWKGKEELAMLRFILLGFFLVYSIAESVILNIK